MIYYYIYIHNNVIIRILNNISVICREIALLYQPGVTSTSALQGIGRIITHENMHMWFGNEVSPQSWTYTWLNEGFANYFESFGTDMVSIFSIYFLYSLKKYLFVILNLLVYLL